MYFSGTIMTFALPLGAFILISIVLFYLFRSAHSGPRLKYPTVAPFTSLGTREPGPAMAAAVVPEETAAPQTVVPEETAAPETTEGKEAKE
jgi:hypothetical protein